MCERCKGALHWLQYSGLIMGPGGPICTKNEGSGIEEIHCKIRFKKALESQESLCNSYCLWQEETIEGRKVASSVEFS
jgi:hypothetical protein